jgi:hypothetical protein
MTPIPAGDEGRAMGRRTGAARALWFFAAVAALVAALDVQTLLAAIGYGWGADAGYGPLTVVRTAAHVAVPIALGLAALRVTRGERWAWIVGWMSTLFVLAFATLLIAAGLLVAPGEFAIIGTLEAVVGGILGVAGILAARSLGRAAPAPAPLDTLATTGVVMSALAALAVASDLIGLLPAGIR